MRIWQHPACLKFQNLTHEHIAIRPRPKARRQIFRIFSGRNAGRDGGRGNCESFRYMSGMASASYSVRLAREEARRTQVLLDKLEVIRSAPGIN